MSGNQASLAAWVRSIERDVAVADVEGMSDVATIVSEVLVGEDCLRCSP